MTDKHTIYAKYKGNFEKIKENSILSDSLFTTVDEEIGEKIIGLQVSSQNKELILSQLRKQLRSINDQETRSLVFALTELVRTEPT